MSAEDRYDHRGMVLDGPDDPGEAACREHGNAVGSCLECRAEFVAWLADQETWARATLPPPDALDDISDLPF